MNEAEKKMWNSYVARVNKYNLTCEVVVPVRHQIHYHPSGLCSKVCMGVKGYYGHCSIFKMPLKEVVAEQIINGGETTVYTGVFKRCHKCREATAAEDIQREKHERNHQS